MENSNLGLLQLLPYEVWPNENFKMWLENDGFKPEVISESNQKHYLEELTRVKASFIEGINNNTTLLNADGKNLNPLEIYNLIQGYRIRIEKLRLVIKPEFTIAKHSHLIKSYQGTKNVNYFLARSYWIGTDGKKYRKFSKNLGAEDKVLVKGIVPQDDLDKIEKELVQMSWDQYKYEYLIFTRETSLGNQEFTTRIDKIDLHKEENYDCTTDNVWSFHKAEDIREGVNIRFGNMCNGFPFEVAGIKFINSECAYIAGAYAAHNPESIRIQREIAIMNNGLTCKRKYRRNQENAKFIREDFYDYNIEWMKYVLWQKCLQRKDFADLLKQIPLDAHLVENSTLHNGVTEWGCKNKELMDVRKLSVMEVEKRFKGKKGLRNARISARNEINNIGHFVGKNMMGKILKVCSLCLIYGQQPTIDYKLLQSKGIFMFGNEINFIGCK